MSLFSGLDLGLVLGCLLGYLLVVFLILFGFFWEPWGHIWETCGKIDAEMEHFGTRGTTKNVTFLCFVSDPSFLTPEGDFLKVFHPFGYFLMTFGKVLGFSLTF